MILKIQLGLSEVAPQIGWKSWIRQTTLSSCSLPQAHQFSEFRTAWDVPAKLNRK
jgi:hypothetical protein